jgi:hypothetical protein
VATNACVEMTVRDAADRDCGVIAGDDEACAGLSEELHRAALMTMERCMGLVRMMPCRSARVLLREMAGPAASSGVVDGSATSASRAPRVAR